MTDNDAKLSLAIKLFERGFSESRIEACLRQCRTIDEAMIWLAPTPSGAAQPTSSESGAISSKRFALGSLKRGTSESSSSGLVGTASADAKSSQRRRTHKKTDASAWSPSRQGKGTSTLAENAEAIVTQSLAGANSVGDAKRPDNCSRDGSVALTSGTASFLASAEAASASGRARAERAAARAARARAENAENAETSENIERTAELAVAASSKVDQLEAESTPHCEPSGADDLCDAEPAKHVPEVIAIPIPPADATEWWAQAADRWRSALADLQAKFGTSGISIGDSDDSSNNLETEGISDQHVSEPASSASGPMSSPVKSDGALSTSPSTAEARSSLASPMCKSFTKSTEVERKSRISTPGTPALRLSDSEQTCAICCNDVPKSRAVRLNCGHGWYCASCVLRHAEARLQLGSASVTCPECNENLAERFLRKLLPEELIEKLLARSLEQAVSSGIDLRACPTPNCPMRVALEDGELPRLKCTHCKRESCLLCGAQPYHKNLTCEEHAERERKRSAKGKRQQQERDRLEGEQQFMEWMKETGTKQCPVCQMAVSKQNLDNQNTQYSECHKMLCRSCNTKFCFKCLATLTDSYSCKCTRADHGFADSSGQERCFCRR
eukprot:TRINITY_DN21965_c0_g1_i2.p1 TRINITY_DN21965_c0_g1~~TRINITY_DN21965_c0_g1_i2.p1  ORF type:complete len:616 (-),score=81.03 TRINITY_DN21965_c0_g1_i2:80-1927(-)